MLPERLSEAAQRVLSGDSSLDAAHRLEAVLIEDYSGDERFEDLHEALALYAPFDEADIPAIEVELEGQIDEKLSVVGT